MEMTMSTAESGPTIQAFWDWGFGVLWTIGLVAVMIGLTTVLVPIAISHQRKILRAEGALLLVAYVGYLTLRVVREL